MKTKTYEERVKLLGLFEQENQRLREEFIPAQGRWELSAAAEAAGAGSEAALHRPSRPHRTSVHTHGRAGSLRVY